MAKNNLLYGLRSIIEAIQSGKEIEKVFLKKDLSNPIASELKGICRNYNIPISYVPIEKINRITTKNHQGAIAYTSEIEYKNIEEILIRAYEEGRTPLFLILDEITDTRNLGAIARTAECCGVDAIVLPIKGSALINSDTIKTSAGALHYLNICRVKSLVEVVKYLKDSGLQIFAADEKNNIDYTEVKYSEPCAIIMGSEESGICKELLDLADNKITIPVLGQIKSLNVSVATAVILYEVVKQRK